MKKYLFIAIVIALIGYQHWGDIQNYINPTTIVMNNKA